MKAKIEQWPRRQQELMYIKEDEGKHLEEAKEA